MRIVLIFIAVFFFDVSAMAQHYRLTLASDKVIFTDYLSVNSYLFRAVPNVIVGDRRLRLDSIREIYDSNLNFTYKAIRFRRNVLLARQLEYGKINLYDLHLPDERASNKTRRNSISSNNRFYYHLTGDTVLSVLNRKNYDSLFDSEFALGYPAFTSIKKKYLRLHTTGIVSSIMWPNLIVVTGFQSAAFLASYIATTTFLTGTNLINRQVKFNRVRNMIRDYNEQSHD